MITLASSWEGWPPTGRSGRSSRIASLEYELLLPESSHGPASSIIVTLTCISACSHARLTRACLTTFASARKQADGIQRCLAWCALMPALLVPMQPAKLDCRVFATPSNQLQYLQLLDLYGWVHELALAAGRAARGHWKMSAHVCDASNGAKLQRNTLLSSARQLHSKGQPSNVKSTLTHQTSIYHVIVPLTCSDRKTFPYCNELPLGR